VDNSSLNEDCNRNLYSEHRVLVVDDNPLILNVLQKVLRSEGLNVIPASNGVEALDQIRKSKIDLIVCDVMMPVMGGYELHEKVIASLDCVHVPFIFLTALDDREEVENGRRRGIDDYVIKPFEVEELLSRIRNKIIKSKYLQNSINEKFDTFRKKIIHTLSHEFRTPLVAINTGAELLQDLNEEVSRERVQKLIDGIRRGGERLERLVNNFMILQQLEAGIAERTYQNNVKFYEVHQCVEDFVENFSICVKQAGFQLEVKINCSELYIKICQSQIFDVLTRLLENAMKFSVDKKVIALSVQECGESLKISCRDYGIGIDPSRAEEAMTAFGQLDREHLEQQGGGLGLAIASKYVEINKGRISFALPEDCVGTVVNITLPVYEKWQIEEEKA
jgi:two-component system, sensor histidine kinase and response regulator